MITAAGYTLVAVDYPLAPEWPLECSVELSFQALSQLIEHELAELGCDRYVLFGRSAGGYLALKMAAELASKRPDLQQPAAIWDFYGYWNLEDPFVSTPSAHYAAMPAVDTATVNALTGPSGSLVFEAPRPRGFPVCACAPAGSWGACWAWTRTTLQRCRRRARISSVCRPSLLPPAPETTMFPKQSVAHARRQTAPDAPGVLSGTRL